MNQTHDTTKQPRRHRLTTALALAGVALVIGILGKGLTLNPNAGTNALLGKPAKDFRVSTLVGGEHIGGSATFNLSTLHGSPVILNFWASWCVSCQGEAHTLEAFWQAHRGEGVRVVGIAIQDTPEAAKKFAQHFGKTYLLGLDDEGKASIDYGVTGVPETFFIDSQGIIRQKISGPLDEATLSEGLALIKAPVVKTP